jgi:hypothetical protein
MNDMTAQEVFDTVVAHLRTQGAKATDAEGCLYRGPNGTSCAAGCLIKNEEYNPEMERQNIGALLGRDSTPIALRDRLLPHVPLLMSLQSVHDDYEAGDWEERFAHVATKFGLSFSPKGE